MRIETLSRCIHPSHQTLVILNLLLSFALVIHSKSLVILSPPQDARIPLFANEGVSEGGDQSVYALFSLNWPSVALVNVTLYRDEVEGETEVML